MKNRIGRKVKGRIPGEKKLKRNGAESESFWAERRGKRENHTKRADWLPLRGRQRKFRDKAHKKQTGSTPAAGEVKSLMRDDFLGTIG